MFFPCCAHVVVSPPQPWHTGDFGTWLRGVCGGSDFGFYLAVHLLNAWCSQGCYTGEVTCTFNINVFKNLVLLNDHGI